MPKMRQLIRAVIDQLPPRIQSKLLSLRSRDEPKLGSRTYLHRSVQMLGKAHIRVGDNSVISEDGWLNVNHRQGNEYAIEIGSQCFIGRRNVFSSGKKIQIGDYVLTANDCQFLGSTHIATDPMQPIITTGTTDNDVIVVGSNSFLGAGVRVVGNVRIGHGCVIGAGSLVTRDVPPFTQAHGSPAIVFKRYSFPAQRWVSIDDFSTADELAIPTEESYVTRLSPANLIRMPYIACGSDMGNC